MSSEKCGFVLRADSVLLDTMKLIIDKIFERKIYCLFESKKLKKAISSWLMYLG